MSIVTIQLSAPIQAHGETLVALELRRPTVQDCRDIKALPYKIDKDESVSLDLDIASKYIAVCAGIPPGSVGQLELHDFNGIAWAVAGFFMAAASPKSES
ncbi:phage tail assembly protein [Pseudomonas sp. 8(2025)]|uniref:phage tail assembly protein n=1 Tax=Pseudomonas sp. 8(2025) TaxID=3456022 RepID=UPI00404450DE